MLRKIWICIVLTMSCSLMLNAQNAFSRWNYSVSTSYSNVLQTNDFIRGINEDNTAVKGLGYIAFSASKTTDYSKSWHYLYHDYRYGFGAFAGRFSYSRHLNNPFAVYAFFGFTPMRFGRLSLRNEMALGFSFLWDVYDSVSNPYNIAVSMPVESYIHLSYEAAYRLSPHWDVALGLQFVHFSNGAFVKPNKGINAFGPKLSATYFPAGKGVNDFREPDYTDTAINSREKWNILFNAYYGVHALWLKESPIGEIQKAYSVTGVQARVRRVYSDKYSFGVGMDATYNNAFGKNDLDYYREGKDRREFSFMQKSNMSFFLSMSYSIHDFSILLEPGFYFAFSDYYAYFPKAYQRIGCTYNISEHAFCQVALRAYQFHVADFIEFGLGYRIKKW